MKNKGLLLSLAIGVALFFAFYPPINNAQKEAALMESILTEINYYHYKPLDINDALSEKVYDLFLDRLDGSRRWLTQDDVNNLRAFRTELDDEAKQGTFAFLDLATQLQEAGIKKSEGWFKDILSKPFDFTGNETYESSTDKKPFAKDDAELRTYWEQSLKWETMTRLADKLRSKEKGEEDFKDKSYEQLEEEARKDVLKVFNDWYTRLGKRKRSDHVSMYLNAFTNIFDPHTEYFEPIDKQNFDIGMSGKFEGIGARLQTDGDVTKVSEIIVGGPAWKGGILKENDKIIKVAQGDNPEWIDITGMVINDVVQLIRGEKGTKVRLYVKKAEGGNEEISIVRDVVITSESFAKSLLIDSEYGEKIGYLRLPKFYADFQDRNGRRCAEDVKIELEKLKKSNVDGIILDLRNNGGGSLRDVVTMSGYFVEQGPMVQVKSRSRDPEVLADEDPSVQYTGPLIVMVNQFSASASEILAAALQDYGRAIIVGTGNSTFGKGTVQRFFDLDQVVRGNPELKPLGNVKLTVQKFFRVNGGSTQLKGVTPDIVLPDTWLYVETGEKEEDFPMEWTQIDPVRYSQNVYGLQALPDIRERSAARLRNDPTFQAIFERAKTIKDQRDDSAHVLNLDSYQAENEAWEADSEKYNKLFEAEVVPNVSNLEVDLPEFKADESAKARNDEWIKGVKKDVYLKETLHIIHDMIAMK